MSPALLASLRLPVFTGIVPFVVTGISLFVFASYVLCESASDYGNFTASRFRFHNFDSIEQGPRESRLFSFAADDGDVKVSNCSILMLFCLRMH